jgi:hypothetical protein
MKSFFEQPFIAPNKQYKEKPAVKAANTTTNNTTKANRKDKPAKNS